MCCPRCGGAIINKEQEGAVDDGDNFWHADCWKDRFGNESALDLRRIREIRREQMEREVRWDKVTRWANFKNLPKGKYGARRIA